MSENGRTHEPNLRELTAQLDGLSELTTSQIESLEKIMNERHELYKERAQSQKVAVDDALKSAKEQTQAAFLASEKAIVKAEDAQKSYNATHNDLLKKMDLLVPVTEARLKWEAADKETQDNRKEIGTLRESLPREITTLRNELMREISGLRESRSGGEGKQKAVERAAETGNTNRNLVIYLIVFTILNLFGWIIAVIGIVLRKP